MALQGKYINNDTEEVHENAYYYLDIVTTETYRDNGIDGDTLLYIGVMVFKNKDDRINNFEGGILEYLSLETKIRKDQNLGILWEYTYNQIKPIIIARMSNGDRTYELVDVWDQDLNT